MSDRCVWHENCIHQFEIKNHILFIKQKFLLFNIKQSYELHYRFDKFI